jgi:hypothetical protein
MVINVGHARPATARGDALQADEGEREPAARVVDAEDVGVRSPDVLGMPELLERPARADRDSTSSIGAGALR